MSSNKSKTTTESMIDEILEFISKSSGLKVALIGDGAVITQIIDEKKYVFSVNHLGEVIHRKDTDGQPFIQINFKHNVRVLFTDSLVGFKPTEVVGLDMGRLPKVVTTPDLKVVFDAIEEALGSDSSIDHEVETLKKLFLSILSGAEKCGFELKQERLWINRLLASKAKALA